MTFPPRKQPTFGGNADFPSLPAGSEKVTLLRPKAPITAHRGEHWKSGLDMLKELVNDIETGRIQPPDVIYVAMQNRHPTNEGLVAYPSYHWAEANTAGLAMLGLLTKHQAKICR